MAWFGPPTSRSLLRTGTAAGVLLTLLLLLTTSDRLHNHPGAALTTAALSAPRVDPPFAPRGAGAGGNAPCLACLHHRTPFVGPAGSAPEGRIVALGVEGCGPVPEPPPAPLARPAGLRAPPLA